MYVGRVRGYNTDAIQLQTGIVDYIPTDSWGNNQSTGSAVADYVILDRMGYYKDVVNIQTGVIDYTHLEGYYKDVVNIQTGILDYLIDNVPYNIIIEQERGWSFNWELINVLWETIDENWNN